MKQLLKTISIIFVITGLLFLVSCNNDYDKFINEFISEYINESTSEDATSSNANEESTTECGENINDYAINNTQAYTVQESELLLGTLVIVNKDHKFDLAEKDLDLIDTYDYRVAHQADAKSPPYKITAMVNSKLTAEAVEHLHDMLTELNRATRVISYINTAYRTFEDQNEFTKPAAAGYSDFHTGLLVSLKGYVGGTALDITAEGNETMYQWLLSNAHKYGFVQRYPEGKETVTGINDYLSCFRYVGVAHATYMKNNNLCLEEYVEFIKNEKPTVENPIKIESKDGGIYAVYYYDYEGGSAEIQVPEKNYTISGTNTGGIIVTVKLK